MSIQPKKPSETEGVPELDVTPVMNMFVILIPFLVSMAVFTHLSVIEFSLPPNVGAGLAGGDGKPKLKMTVVVTEERLTLTYGETAMDSVTAGTGGFDYAVLGTKLTALRENLEIKDEAVIAVRDKIRFENVVRVMDRCREAGFTKIGLSSATADPAKGV